MGVVVVSILAIRVVRHLHVQSKQSARTPKKTVRLSCQASERYFAERGSSGIFQIVVNTVFAGGQQC